jgi:chromosome segregation ATPase
MDQTPGRTGVTFEQVAVIADTIAAQGNRPTLRGVRAELGTGSMGTIQKHLTAWQGTRRAIVTSSATLPTEIQRVILGEIERAVSEARAELEADLAATKGSLDALADDNITQSEQIDQQAARLAEVEAGSQQQAGRILQLEADLAAAGADIKRERDEAANGRQALARAELRLEQLPLLQADAERLRAALESG